MFLSAQQLTCTRQQKTLFADLSFQVKPEQTLLITGANGAGKSSLLRLLTGMATPASGNVYWNDQNIADDLSSYVEHMHYLGHNNGLRLGLTVAENLLLASEIAQQTIQMDQVLSDLQLHTHKDTQTQFLSAGQKRRAALARLLLMPRKLWILDEPFTALDSGSQQLLSQQIDQHVQNGGMCILTSHQAVNLQSATKELTL